MTRPRVMFVISSLDGGGAARVIVDLADFLARQGLEVAITTLEGHQADFYPVPPSVARVRLDIMWESRGLLARLRSTLQRLRIIRQALQQADPDIVVSFIDMTNIRVLLALAGTQIPVVVCERSDPRHHPLGIMWRVLRLVIYRLASRIVVQTEGVATWARRRFSAQRVVTIPNAVRPPGLMKPAPRPRGMPGQRVIIGMGRLVQQKGFDRLILAFSSSGLASKGWSLAILGDGNLRPQLEALVEKEGLANRVYFPGTQRIPEEWLLNADIFVLSSHYEGFPNVLLEAMQCGVATLAFNCDSGPGEIIRHGVDGWLVRPNDVVALGNALCLLAEHTILRKSLSAQATAVLRRFSCEAVYSQWKLLCETLLVERRES